jgi:hypothetical protein
MGRTSGYDRNVEEIIPALSHKSAGTIIIDEDSKKSARVAQEEEGYEKRLYCDGSRIDVDVGHIGA